MWARKHTLWGSPPCWSFHAPTTWAVTGTAGTNREAIHAPTTKFGWHGGDEWGSDLCCWSPSRASPIEARATARQERQHTEQQSINTERAPGMH